MSAVKLEQLRQFTGGDLELEAEVLNLFVENGARYVETISAGGAENSWRIAAHSLKGSARSVGAHEVEVEAEKVEKSQKPDSTQLRKAFLKAKAFIDQHLEGIN